MRRQWVVLVGWTAGLPAGALAAGQVWQNMYHALDVLPERVVFLLAAALFLVVGGVARRSNAE